MKVCGFGVREEGVLEEKASWWEGEESGDGE